MGLLLSEVPKWEAGVQKMPGLRQTDTHAKSMTEVTESRLASVNVRNLLVGEEMTKAPCCSLLHTWLGQVPFLPISAIALLLLCLTSRSADADQVQKKAPTLRMVKAIPPTVLGRRVVNAVALSSDASALALITRDNQQDIVEVYSARSGQLQSFARVSFAKAVAFVDASESILVGGGQLTLWDRAHSRLQLISPTSPEWLNHSFPLVAVDGTGANVVAVSSGSSKELISVWDPVKRIQRVSFDLPENSRGINSLQISHDGSMAISGHLQGDVILWSVRDGRKLKWLRKGDGARGAFPGFVGSNDVVTTVKISDGGKYIAVSALSFPEGKGTRTVTIHYLKNLVKPMSWETREMTSPRDRALESGLWEEIDLCPTKPLLAVCERSGSGRLIDIRSGAVIARFEFPAEDDDGKVPVPSKDPVPQDVETALSEPIHVAISFDGSRIVSVDKRGSVGIWEVNENLLKRDQ